MTKAENHRMPLNDAWGTPLEILAAARAVMGGIDLDPASSEVFNIAVDAGAIYTLDDDGLACPWFGRVFLNPPGGRKRPGVIAWWERLVAEWSEGDVEQAIYISFSLDILAKSQRCRVPVLAFPTVILADRPRFLDPVNLEPQKSPWKECAVTWIPPKTGWDNSDRAVLHDALTSNGVKGYLIGG